MQSTFLQIQNIGRPVAKMVLRPPKRLVKPPVNFSES